MSLDTNITVFVVVVNERYSDSMADIYREKRSNIFSVYSTKERAGVAVSFMDEFHRNDPKAPSQGFLREYMGCTIQEVKWEAGAIKPSALNGDMEKA